MAGYRDPHGQKAARDRLKLAAMEPNERIGPYRLIEPLGSGGMGTVWRAWDERLKRPVALKRIIGKDNEDRKLRERLRREAEAGARLNHPAIVHIYDIVETEASDWIVMELVEGQTLQALLREGPLDPQRVLRLGREITEGLTEAHAQGYIHRDLKALNVMVTRTGRAKILDFGVAKQIQPDAQDTTLSTPGTVIGTSYAMSPEQAMGLPLDARSDLFSLGSLLYEMVTGVAPFRAESSTATIARVCSFRQRPASALRPEIPCKLSHLIDWLLEKDPGNRPGSAMKVAVVLEQIDRTPESPSDVSEQETIIELPVHQTPAVLSVAAEPARPVGSNARQQSMQPGARDLRAAIGIAYTFYQQGIAFLDQFDRRENLDLAIDSFQKVLAQDKTHATAHAGLAKAYWLKLQRDGQDPIWLEQALLMAERAVALDPYLADTQVSLGLALESAGRHEEALRHIERALILEPVNGDAHYAAGKIYESMRKLSEAEAAYKKATEARSHRMYFDGLANFYLRQGRRDEAMEAFRRSL